MAPVIIHLDPVEVLKLGLTVCMEKILGKEIPVLTALSKQRPDEFLLILNGGGIRRDLVVDVPTIILEAWAIRPSRAMLLAETARGLMHWFDDINGTPVYNVSEFAGPGDLPDPLSHHARFTATYSVPMRTARTVEIS